MHTKLTSKIFTLAAVVTAFCLGGCVERELTIVTKPEGAKVVLNDEEIGMSPVTVPFNWYGDYKVRLSKKGYDTLVTHKKLDRPSHDYFPLDIFANIFDSKRVDRYCWNFQLKEYTSPNRNELIKKASNMKVQSECEINQLCQNAQQSEK